MNKAFAKIFSIVLAVVMITGTLPIGRMIYADTTESTGVEETAGQSEETAAETKAKPSEESKETSKQTEPSAETETTESETKEVEPSETTKAAEPSETVVPSEKETAPIAQETEPTAQTAKRKAVNDSFAYIQITTPPTKTKYKAGEYLDISGMVVTAVFLDGPSRTIPMKDYVKGASSIFWGDNDGYKVDDKYLLKPLKSGSYTVEISYENGGYADTASIHIVVESFELTKIEIATPPTKTKYKAGEYLDISGMVVKAYFSDGTSSAISKGYYDSLYNWSGGYKVDERYVGSPYWGPADALDVSDTQVSVEYEYNGVREYAYFDIEVSGSSSLVYVTNITIISPTKTTYEAGEFLDLSGMVVEAHYSDGSSRVVPTDECTVKDDLLNRPLQESDTTVVIVYSDLVTLSGWFSIIVLPETNKTAINSLTFETDCVPAAGKTNSECKPSVSVSEKGIKIVSCKWVDKSGADLSDDHTFVLGEVVHLFVAYQIESGYKLAADIVDNIRMNGNKATIQDLRKNELKFSFISKYDISGSETEVTGFTDVVYTGEHIKPAITVKYNGKELVSRTDYIISITGNVNVGTAEVTITGYGNYTGQKKVAFKILQAANFIAVAPKTAKVKYKKLKKKAQTVTGSKVLTVSGFKGDLNYSLVGVKRGKSKKYKKYFKINAKTGNVTVKKKLKKGTYKITCKVTAGNTNYQSVSKTVTFKIKVK